MDDPNTDSASELLHLKATTAAVAQAHLAPRVVRRLRREHRGRKMVISMLSGYGPPENEDATASIAICSNRPVSKT